MMCSFPQPKVAEIQKTNQRPNVLHILICLKMEYIWGAECYWSGLEGISQKCQDALNTAQDILSKVKDPRDVNWDEMPF
jgi:hypothetical protein